VSLEPIPIREVLVCQALDRDRQVLLYALVLRKGLEFELLGIVRGDHTALLTDQTTLELLERRFELPVRVFFGDPGAFLGAQTLLARQKGTNYSLKSTSS
jgi:hypothetical protein